MAKCHLYLKNQVSRLQSAILRCCSLLKDVLNINHTVADAMPCSCHYCEPQAIITYINKGNKDKLYIISLQNCFTERYITCMLNV